MRYVLRFFPAVLAFALHASPVRALEGAPPFEIVPAGRSVQELTAEVWIAPDAGFGGGYMHGPGTRSMRTRSYFMAPIGARYGLWKTVEAWGVVPLVWGESPQEYDNVRTGGATETYRSTLSGFDGSDVAVGLRWEPYSTVDDDFALVLTCGMGLPLGTNPWQNSQNNFVTGPVTPDFSSGDGAYKLLLAVEGIWDSPNARVSALAGYLHRFSQEATAIEPPASTVNVTLPAPVVGWLKPAWKLSEDSWLTARIDGFWARRGSISTGGLLTRTPEALPAILDSYMSLVDGSWGIWAGLGTRQGLSASSALEVEVCAPVLARNIWRTWRVVAALTWNWKP